MEADKEQNHVIVWMEKLVLEIVNLVENKQRKTVTLKVCKNFMEKLSKTRSKCSWNLFPKNFEKLIEEIFQN